MLNLSILLKYYAKIVFNRSKSLIGHFYDSIGEKIDHIFLNLKVELIGGLIEESTLDLGSIHIDELNLEQ